MVRERKFYRTLLLIALPVAFQSFISLGVNMLDNIMVGSLDEITLSGVALANQLVVFITFFIRGVSGGASVLISQYWGKKDMEKIKTIFAIIFQFVTISILIIGTFVFLFPTQIMRLFANDEAVIMKSAEFLKIIAFSFVLFAISDVLISMLRCVEVVKIGLIISIVTLFTNLFFNYMLIFGHWIFPALGMRGAGYATCIARAVEFSVVIFYVFVVDKRLKFRLKDIFRKNKLLFQDFFKFGMPIVAGDMQWGLVGVFKAMIIGHLGASMIAANSIAEVVLSLGAVFTNGLSSAACVVIGKSIGESKGDYTLTQKYSSTIQWLFFMVGFVMMGFIFLFRHVPVSFYNISEETKALANTLLAIGAVTMLGTTYHAACFTGINRGGGDSRFVFLIDMMCGWGIVLPLSLLVAFVIPWANPAWTLPLTFLMTKIDQCFKWIIAFFRLRGTKWIKIVTRDEKSSL